MKAGIVLIYIPDILNWKSFLASASFCLLIFYLACFSDVFRRESQSSSVIIWLKESKHFTCTDSLCILNSPVYGYYYFPHLQKRKLRWRETESFQHYTASVAEVETLAQGLWLQNHTLSHYGPLPLSAAEDEDGGGLQMKRIQWRWFESQWRSPTVAFIGWHVLC